MDIVIIKEGLIYFSNLEKESKFRKFLFYFAWTFLAIVPILEKLLFGFEIIIINPIIIIVGTDNTEFINELRLKAKMIKITDTINKFFQLDIF